MWIWRCFISPWCSFLSSNYDFQKISQSKMLSLSLCISWPCPYTLCTYIVRIIVCTRCLDKTVTHGRGFIPKFKGHEGEKEQKRYMKSKKKRYIKSKKKRFMKWKKKRTCLVKCLFRQVFWSVVKCDEVCSIVLLLGTHRQMFSESC